MQKNKHNKNDKKLFNPLRLILLLLIFFSLSFTTITLISRAHGDVVHDENGKILYAGDSDVAIRGVASAGMSGSEVCEFSNSHSSNEYFIPSRYVQEWNSVKTAGSGNHPHITLECCGAECFSSCSTPCGEIDHGEDCRVYEYSSPCDYCRSTLVECDDGEWSSLWNNTSCTVASCRRCGLYSSWTCEDSTTRERTRTCYDCVNNQCQSYLDTDTESCSTGEVCEDGECVDDGISCEWWEELCQTNHDDMEPFCYDPSTHDCCVSNSSTYEPVICDKHDVNLCNQSDCLECLFFEYDGSTSSGSETCIEEEEEEEEEDDDGDGPIRM